MKQLNYTEFKKVYNNYIKYDFPLLERRPLFSIKQLYKEDKYLCYVYEDIEIKAYSSFTWSSKCGVVLLDYFAINKKYRNSGIGSSFINDLKHNINAKGIIIECDAPESTNNDIEKKTRERRIAFYLKNGAQSTNIKVKIAGVEYLLLWISLAEELENIDIKYEILNIYHNMYPKIFYKSIIKIVE